MIALADGSHPLHSDVSAVVTDERGPFFLSPFVLQEIDHLVSERLGQARALAILESVASGAYTLESFAADDIAVATNVMRRYGDMPVGLADASIVVIASRRGTDRLLTLDERHFRAIRPLQGGTFSILPADL